MMLMERECRLIFPEYCPGTRKRREGARDVKAISEMFKMLYDTYAEMLQLSSW
jgi:hypothetical protein